MATSGDNMNERLVRVEEKVDALADKVDELTVKFEGLTVKFDGLTVQFENVREDIQKLGEGYEQGLNAISRQISEMDRRWADKWSTHDLAITDHGKRITALEQRHK